MPLSRLYLASRSPRRREILQQIGVPFQLLDIDISETPLKDERPVTYVQRMAYEKAQAGVNAVLPAAGVVLGADTVVICDGQIMQKPNSEEDAVKMLQKLSGRTHTVLSAVSLCGAQFQQNRLSATEVEFRMLTERECKRYWATGEPADKAGAYGIQGYGAVFVSSIRGSYSGVVGLPIEETCQLLEQAGIHWWQLSDTDSE